MSLLLVYITVLVAAFAGAGIALLLRKISGNRLPRALVPIGAGAAMIAATIATEYSWFPTQRDALPDGVEVIATYEAQDWYRPWTYGRPFTESFVAMDAETVRTHADFPDQYLVTLYAFSRFIPAVEVPVLIDCAEGRRLDLVDGVEFDDGGAPQGGTWVTMDDANPIREAVCTTET